MLRGTSLSFVAVATARHRRGSTRDALLIWQVATPIASHSSWHTNTVARMMQVSGLLITIQYARDRGFSWLPGQRRGHLTTHQVCRWMFPLLPFSAECIFMAARGPDRRAPYYRVVEGARAIVGSSSWTDNKTLRAAREGFTTNVRIIKYLLHG